MKTLRLKHLALALAIFCAIAVKATIITVTVNNFSFTPSTFTAVIGDTIEWEWVGGTHTTTSLTVPTGAASWDNPMTSSSTKFAYVITTNGAYTYWCSIHQTMMEGSFSVGPIGIPPVDGSARLSASVYPNPASTVLNVKMSYFVPGSQIVITDIQGREVKKELIQDVTTMIDLSGMAKGMYMYYIKHDEDMIQGKFEVE